MAKKHPTLADVDPARWDSPANPAESEASHDPDSQLAHQEAASEATQMVTHPKAVADAAPVPPRSKRQPGRRNTVMIGCHLPAEVSYSLHELCGKLSMQQNERVTIQDILKEALSDVFKKHKTKIPAGLTK